MDVVMTVTGKPIIVLIVAWLLSLLLRRKSASVRHAIWFLAILAAAVLPLADAALPKWDLPLRTELTTVFLTRQSAESAATGFAETSAQTVPGQTLPGSEVFGARRYIVFIWLMGFAVVMLRFILGARAARRLLHEAHLVGGPEWSDILEPLRVTLRVPKSPRIAISAGRCCPMTSGILQPTIILPSDAGKWSAERRRLVLAHELSHVKRNDSFVQVAIQTICGIYWFNPLFWYAARCLSIERERLCDDAVLGSGADRYRYATALVEIARAGSSTALAGGAIAMAQPSQLEARLRAIVDARQNRRILSRSSLAIVSLAMACGVLLTTTVRVTAMSVPVIRTEPLPPGFAIAKPVPEPVKRLPAELQTLPAIAASIISEEEKIAFLKLGTAEEREHFIEAFWTRQSQRAAVFQKWLEEDVAYITSDEEKTAFAKLINDNEREFFIEQFWARRDPTPGTPRNEFREEHYERLAYANLRFAWAGQPGWKSDRARIYITRGKPDEVESHNAGPDTYPYDVWLYTSVSSSGGRVSKELVRFEFVDPARNGEYRLRTP